MNKSVLFCLSMSSLFGCITIEAYGQEDFSNVYGKVNNSVVLIEFADQAREVGSGVVIGVTSRGLAIILTANHVVKGYERVIVSFSGIIDQQYPGRIHQDFIDDADDLALVYVQNAPSSLELISFRPSEAKKGERVGTIGHPQDEVYTWTDGAINNIFGKYIRHSAELQVGSSGGPLLDACGRMLGMNVQVIVPPEPQTEDELPAVQDSLEVGSSVTLAAKSVLSVIEGWFSAIEHKEKWKLKKYCSFRSRLIQDPKLVALWVGGLVGGITLWVTRNGNGAATFGGPPGPEDIGK